MGLDIRTTICALVCTVVSGKEVSLYPTGDAYVERSRPSFNVHTGVLEVQKFGKTEYESFLKFDLSSVSASGSKILSAKLKMTPLFVGDSGITNNIALVSDNTWMQNSITWNLKPTSSPAIGSWEAVKDRPAEVDVTYYAQKSMDSEGDKKLSFRMYSPVDVSAKASVQYGSSRREFGKPELILEVRVPTSASQSTATGEGLLAATAGTPAVFVVTAKDAGGDPQVSGADKFSMTLGDEYTTINGTVLDNLDGTYTVSYVPLIAGPTELKVTLDGQNIVGSPFQIEVQPAATSAKHCIASGEGLIEGTAGVASKFTLVAKDAFGNTRQLAESDDVFEVSITGPVTQTAVVTEGVNMTYTAEYTITAAGAYLINVKLGEKSIMGSPFQAVVLPGKTDPAKTVAYGAGLVTSVAGVPSSFAIRARDINENDRAVCGDNFQVSLTGPGRSRVHGLVSETNNGTYIVEYTVTITGAYKIHVTLGGDEIADSPFDMEAAPAETRASHSVATGTALTLATSGKVAEFKILAKDTYGNSEKAGGDKFSVKAVGAGEAGSETIEGEVSDLADGVYTVKYTPKVAGKYEVNVLLDGKHIFGSPFQTVVMPGPTSAANCMIPCMASGDPNCGAKKAVAGLITSYDLVAMDAQDNARRMGGDNFKAELASGRASMGAINVTVMDLSTGKYRMAYRATISGEYSMDLTLGEAKVGSAPYVVKVLPGATSPVKCTAEGDGLSSAIGGETASFYISAKDAYLNPLESGGDLWQATLTHPGVPNVNGTVFDFGNGTYMVSYTSEISGEWMLHVKGGGTDIEGSPFKVEIAPAATFSPTCLASGQGTQLVTVGETGHFLIKTKDKFGNDRGAGGDGVTVALSLEPQLPVPISETGTVVDSKDGVYSAGYNLTYAGIYSMVVKVNGEGIQGSPFTVKAIPAPTSTVDSLASGKQLSAFVAGEAGTFDVFARDRFGNQRKDGGDVWDVYMIGPGYTKVNVSLTDHGKGEYTADFVTTVAGPYSVFVKQNGININGSPYEAFCSPAPTSVSHSIITGDGIKGAEAGVPAVAILRARDVYNNYELAGGDTWAVAMKSSGPSVEVEVADNQDGTYNLTYTATVTGVYDFTAGSRGASSAPDEVGIEVMGSPYQTKVVPTKLSAAKTEGIGKSLTEGTAGAMGRFAVTARDTYGNNREQAELSPAGEVFKVVMTGAAEINGTVVDQNGDGTYAARYMATVAGKYSMAISANGEPIKDSPFTTTVNPAATSVSKCIATGKGISEGKAGVPCTFTIWAKDDFGNQRTKGGDKFTVKGVGPSVGDAVTLVQATVVENGNGTYTAKYVTSVAGNYTLRVQKGGFDIEGSPFSVVIDTGMTDASFSVSTIEGVQEAIAGVPGAFTVMASDEFGNKKSVGGDNFVVTVKGPSSAAAQTETPAVVKDLSNGNYSVHYSVTQMGEYTMSVTMGDMPVSGSPFIAQVMPGPTSARNCEAVGQGWTSPFVGLDNRFGILVKDEYDNLKVSGGQNFVVTVEGPMGDVKESFNATVKQQQDGMYVATYKAKYKGEYMITVKLDGVEHILASPKTVMLEAPGSDSKMCPRNCSGHGFCGYTLGLCKCDAGYEGLDCSRAVMKNKKCPMDCNNAGTCNPLLGKCSCDPGFSGEDCGKKVGGQEQTGSGIACANDCSGHGTCNATSGKCLCDKDWGGSDCSRGGEHEVVFIGNDNVFIYEPSSGYYTVMHYGKDDKCAGLQSPPLAEGMWGSRGKKFTYLDENMLLEYESDSGMYSILTCSDKFEAGKPIPCDGKKVTGQWVGLKGEDVNVIYMGLNKVLFYDSATGKYAVHRLDRNAGQDEDVFAGDAMAQGMWNETVGHFFAYMDSDMVLDYVPSTGYYYYWRYVRSAMNEENPLQGPITAGTFLVEGRKFLALGANLMMAYEPVSGKYHTFTCKPSEFKVTQPLPCSMTGSGSLFSGAVCPNKTMCDYPSRTHCVVDPQCGWCAEASKCQPGSEEGPATGSCLSWDYGVTEYNYKITYMQQGELLNYEPATGKYNIWNVPDVRETVGVCDLYRWPPVASGKLSVINHALVYVGEDQILDYNGGSGAYRIGQCNRQLYRSESHLHCDTLNNGEWPEIQGSHSLTYVGANTLLDFDKSSGAYTFWAYNHAVNENSSPIEDKPRASGSWDSLVGHELTYLDRDLLLTVDPLSGAYNMYKINREVEARDPLEAMSEGKLVMRKKQFVYIGNDALSIFNPTTATYNVYECSRESAGAATVEDDSAPNTGFGSVIFKDSVFPCKLLSSGSVQPGPICNFTTRADCIKQKKCGWCHDGAGKCMHGNTDAVCSPNKCVKFDYGYDDVCETYSECATCTSNPACGFCNDEAGLPSRGCKKGGLTAPTFGSCADWLYDSCSLESCSSFQDCTSCAAKSFCGWCLDNDGECMEGTATKPMKTCAASSYIFQKANCAAAGAGQATAFLDLMERGLVDQSTQ